MNIFYFSVHQILEDDEIRLFKSLGHNVFCLGANSRDSAVQGFRPSIQFSSKEKDFYDDFAELGGKFTFGDLSTIVIPHSFIARFDIIIVMHDFEFIKRFWSIFCGKVVVWRTIGQGIESCEVLLKPFREAGLSIVRYSPVELEQENSLGYDEIIRFCKDPNVYCGWEGDKAEILTFSNLFKQRYPRDFSNYQEIVSGMPSILGGIGNEDAPNSIGLVESFTQIDLLRRCRAYLYASGLYIPYTLNFIEAWMTGIPVIIHAPLERKDKYFEIDRLVENGVNGFVCRNVEEARRQTIDLLENHALAKRIGEAGRLAAIRHFGLETIGLKWARFLEALPIHKVAQPLVEDNSTGSLSMKNMSVEVFGALSLLKPYDIDVGKIRLGNPRDGGYVLADLSSTADVLSFGVGPDVTFEHAMAMRGRKVFLHDHTVDGLPQSHARFRFEKKGVCGAGSQIEGLETLEQHLAKIENASDQLILKMDVEGWEWDVFSTVKIETLERFEQIALEIHWLENLGDINFRQKVVNALTNLNRIFTLFHVHANNCAELHLIEGFTVASVLEVSFVRTDLIRRSPSTQIYPSGLDKANHPSFSDHMLLFYPFLPSRASDHDISSVVHRVDMEKRLVTT